MPVQYKRIEVDGIRYYGKHLILSASECNEKIKNKSDISNFIKTVVEKIDMVAFGELIVERFGQDIEMGISAVQLIETSAITLHTNDVARDMYLDVFSCKGFDEEVVINFLKELFEPASVNFQIILRK